MSSFSEFSKAHHEDPISKKSKPVTEDIAKNRIDPNTGNEREDRENVRNLHESKKNPRTPAGSSDRSQNRNNVRT